MRALVLIMALAGFAALCGCQGVARTPSEIQNNAAQSVDMDLRQITDDWNTLWMVDRQYRLTRWHTR